MYYFRCHRHGNVQSLYYNRCPSCVRDRRLSYANSLEHMNYPSRYIRPVIESRIRMRNGNNAYSLASSRG